MRQLILHQAESKLSKRSRLFARSVSCDFEDGVLKLSGKVPTFYLKQTAQALLQGIDGVSRVENSLLVVSPYGVSSEPMAAAG
ncbi:MAG: BON domain-containing protein [Planctomycetota bacterium]